MESKAGLIASPVGISQGTGCRTKDIVSDDCSCSFSVGIGVDLGILSGCNSSCSRMLSASLSCPFFEVAEWQELSSINDASNKCFIIAII